MSHSIRQITDLLNKEAVVFISERPVYTAGKVTEKEAGNTLAITEEIIIRLASPDKSKADNLREQLRELGFSIKGFSERKEEKKLGAAPIEVIVFEITVDNLAQSFATILPGVRFTSLEDMPDKLQNLLQAQMKR